MFLEKCRRCVVDLRVFVDLFKRFHIVKGEYLDPVRCVSYRIVLILVALL